MKLNKIIKLSDAFATEVNVLRDYTYRSPEGNIEKVNGYLPNKSSRDIFKSVLLSCSQSTDKKLHLIISSYGTGKSYLLLILANLLANKKIENNFIDKINDKEDYYKDGFSSTLKNHIENSNPLLIVIPEYGDSDFDHALLEGLKFALKKNNIDYVPKTNYEEAIKTINHWKDISPQNYKQLNERIKGTTIEKFIEQLNSYIPSTYLEFKKIYKEIIGNTFSDSHTSAYPIFADTAKEISKHGYRGIAIIYDEFGEMLGKVINSSSSSTGLAIQQFIEDLKDKRDSSNILFICASHQDPQSLRASKEKDLNKIIGRFEKHQLMVSEAEGEEIMGTIFIKEDPIEYEIIKKDHLFSEHLETIEDFKLYPEKDSSWIKTKVLENLYPLHPLTSYILPRLSAEFAQNTRSMFNFLSPTETKDGAFRNYLESKNAYENGKLNLFTPDMLLDFFLKNIKEDKSGTAQTYYEAYKESLGKVKDDYQQSVMKNLFMLCIQQNALIQPNKETLFWAMNWEDSRRKEFYNLLDDLVTTWEFLELNPTNKNYQFPDFGAAPLSKVIDEEINKLDELSLQKCMPIWKEIFEIENFQLRDHNNKFGCNRNLYTETINDIGVLKNSIKELEDYYKYKMPYFGNGYIFYLIGRSEDEIDELIYTIEKNSELLPYIVYASPVNLPQFDNLIKETVHFKALQNTATRNDVLQNPSRLKNIQDQLELTHRKLIEKIKNLYEPTNWKWNYIAEKNIEITSKPKFSTWINKNIDLLFSETPIIKDEALWFTDGNKGGTFRKQALLSLLTSEKDRIPLKDDNSSAADKRIIKAFFSNSDITVDRKRDKGIQYGEIKTPSQDSQFYKAWNLIDKKLKSGSFVNPHEIINSLIQAPYGYSDNIIKFLLTAYIRYDIERISISNTKRNVQSISVELIDNLFNKPADFLIRKIEITGPELRYLTQLKKLFAKEDVNTWMDVSIKFIGIHSFLTPVQKSFIKDSGDKDLQAFYESLEILKSEFNINGADKERISQQYFQENLPTLLFNEGPSLIEDNIKVDKLILKLDAFKKYPNEKEAELKLDVIRKLSEDVFGTNIVTKIEITNVVENWFKDLPAPNQSGRFDDKIIVDWLFEIKNKITNDPFELYLIKLNEKPIKDWEDISYEKFNLIKRFEGYKKAIEEYTKSPIEVFQIISREIFQKSASECDSENTFDKFIKEWWEALPNSNKNQKYSEESNLFISQILFPSSVKTKYLEIIPQAWSQLEYLPPYISTQWESWSNSDAAIVGGCFKKCIKEVTAWKPPVEEKQLFRLLSKLFNVNEVESIIELHSLIKEWFSNLPERTKTADWSSINESISKLILKLDDPNSFEEFVVVSLTSSFKLPEFKLWNDIILKNYFEKFKLLKSSLDDYKRPLFELIEVIEIKETDSVTSEEAYCYKLFSKIKESDASKNKINTNLLNDPISVIFYEQAQKSSEKFTLENIVILISDEMSISNDWNLWSEKEEKSFVTLFKKGLNNLIKWKFPEAELLKKAKTKVKSEILLLQKELELDEAQMRKVLNDILEEN